MENQFLINELKISSVSPYGNTQVSLYLRELKIKKAIRKHVEDDELYYFLERKVENLKDEGFEKCFSLLGDIQEIVKYLKSK